MRELTIHKREVEGLGFALAKAYAASRLQAAGFEFEVFNALSGDYELQRPYSRTVDIESGAVLFRQWDAIPQKGQPK